MLSRHTRFGIGGPADVVAEISDEASFVQAVEIGQASGAPCTLIGGGTNLIVSDRGFPGIVLRFTGAGITGGAVHIHAQAGADLQALVDFSIRAGLGGLQTMTGIPGSLGAAIYGNAGAYGHSLDERIRSVRFFDGAGIRSVDNSACEFRYRESIFKRRKDWVILSADLALDRADSFELQKTADQIFNVRLAKYPADMKCAGSIFKNLLLAELSEDVQRQVPQQVIREGKVPSAYFLEQVGAKGIQNGGIRVADYHANLIYNQGDGTAAQLCQIIGNLKARVHARFGLELEEEVQYIGFSQRDAEFAIKEE